jgi:hypothetical protein
MLKTFLMLLTFLLFAECQKNDWKEHKMMCRKPELRCEVCDVICEKMLECSGCKASFYCGANCQKNDWPQHKLWCPSVKKRIP